MPARLPMIFTSQLMASGVNGVPISSPLLLGGLANTHRRPAIPLIFWRMPVGVVVQPPRHSVQRTMGVIDGPRIQTTSFAQGKWRDRNNISRPK